MIPLSLSGTVYEVPSGAVTVAVTSAPQTGVSSLKSVAVMHTGCGYS